MDAASGQGRGPRGLGECAGEIIAPNE